jgi:hypothetical protein
VKISKKIMRGKREFFPKRFKDAFENAMKKKIADTLKADSRGPVLVSPAKGTTKLNWKSGVSFTFLHQYSLT